MPTIDIAKVTQEALVAHWATAHPTWTPTLHVDDDYRPAAGSPTLLVADDGSTAVNTGPWMVRKTLRTHTIRLTAFAKGRDEARSTVDTAVDHIIAHRPAGLTRFEDVSEPLITRDRATGAFLASITAQVVVRPVTAA